eukprot:2226111-Prymnesium_polylepis.1
MPDPKGVPHNLGDCARLAPYGATGPLRMALFLILVTISFESEPPPILPPCPPPRAREATQQLGWAAF